MGFIVIVDRLYFCCISNRPAPCEELKDMELGIAASVVLESLA